MAVGLRDLSGAMLLNGMPESPLPASLADLGPTPGTPRSSAFGVSLFSDGAISALAEPLPSALLQLRQGSSMALFHQKKSQRPERKTFVLLAETRQLVWWSRGPEKLEGLGEATSKWIILISAAP